MQTFETSKIGIYVSIFNALPEKEKYHIHGDDIIGDNKSITIIPNDKPGMIGRVTILLKCDLTDIVVEDIQMVYTITTEAKETVEGLFCKYNDMLEKNGQNILAHLRSIFDTVYTRDTEMSQDEWFINSQSRVTMNLSDNMTHIVFEVVHKDIRSITTTQRICLPLYRITPDSVVNSIIPTIQSFISI